MEVTILSRKIRTAKKDHKTDLHDYLDSFIIKDENKNWKVNQEDIKYFDIIPDDVKVIEKRANENFLIHRGEKYYYETGIYDGFYDFKIPLDLREVMDKYDLWHKQD